MWVRVFLTLRVTTLLGPLIKMILAMLRDLGVFIMIYSISIALFCFIGMIMFPELEEYSTAYKTFVHLFSTSLGEYDFSLYQSLITTDPEYGEIYLIAFLVVYLILLLNLLIALMSNTYSNYVQHSKALFSVEIAKLNNTKVDDDRYGALISAPPVLDLCILPFLPYYIMSKDPSRINKLLYYPWYFPLLVFAVLMQITIDLVLAPIVYLLAIYTKLCLLGSQENTKKAVLDLVFYVFTGPFL